MPPSTQAWISRRRIDRNSVLWRAVLLESCCLFYSDVRLRLQAAVSEVVESIKNDARRLSCVLQRIGLGQQSKAELAL